MSGCVSIVNMVERDDCTENDIHQKHWMVVVPRNPFYTNDLLGKCVLLEECKCTEGAL